MYEIKQMSKLQWAPTGAQIAVKRVVSTNRRRRICNYAFMKLNGATDRTPYYPTNGCTLHYSSLWKRIKKAQRQIGNFTLLINHLLDSFTGNNSCKFIN